jgi:multiple antibiotic resistance protein
MIEFVLASFAALFVTINPIKGATVFVALMEGAPPSEQRRVAVRATLIASVVLLGFTLFGDNLLRAVGISLAGVRVGGGILLLLLSIDIVFGRPIGPASAAEAGSSGRADVSVFPLATPMIAGPAAITAVVVQATEAHDELVMTTLLLAVVAIIMVITLGAFLIAARIEAWLGEAGTNVVARILGILLAAVSAEMILAGLKQSGVFHP